MNLKNLTLISVAVVPAATLHAASRADERPNIVVILSDDMSWNSPGFNGGTVVPTPNLDRIAKEGVKMTQFYVSPVSTPTRATLMTGRYPFRTGGEKRPHGNDTYGMRTDERTIAEALRDAGYYTVLIGKWHLGEWYSKHLPLQRGFDHHYGFYNALIDYYNHDRDGVRDWHRNGKPLKEEGYSTFLLANEFERVVKERNKSKPFFAYVAFNAVHGPLDAPKEYLDKYNSQKNPKYFGALECLDMAIGQILATLEKENVLDNTIVIFFNDNGGTAATGNKPYRGFKGDLYEGGIRVPCVARYPKSIPAGITVDELTCVADFYPTLVNLAKGSLNQPLLPDGIDIFQVMTGKAKSPRKELVHWLGNKTSHTEDRAIRSGDFKLIEFSDGRAELYNIIKDPYETNDIAKANKDMVKTLSARLQSLIPERREADPSERIPGYPVRTYGEGEDALFDAL